MLTMAMALLGGVFFSQAPEFAQQYRQRIGGALDELRAVITQFDNEANRNGLDREKALGLYTASPEDFLRSQGGAMRHNFNRYTSLEQQSRDLQAAAPISKPFVILRNPDPDLITNAWRDFNPGIPVNLAGLAWAAVGLVIGWLMAALFGTVSLRAARRRPHIKLGPRRKGLAENASDDELRRTDIQSPGSQPEDVARQPEFERELPQSEPLIRRRTQGDIQHHPV
jgi:hypothetical protein